MFSGQVLMLKCSLANFSNTLHTVLCDDLYSTCVYASRTVFWDRSCVTWSKCTTESVEQDDDDEEADKDWYPQVEEEGDRTRKRKTLVGLEAQTYKTIKETRHTRYEAK